MFATTEKAIQPTKLMKNAINNIEKRKSLLNGETAGLNNNMEIIIVTKSEGKGGYQARVFGKNPPIQAFAKTEIEALKHLVEKLEKRHTKRIQ